MAHEAERRRGGAGGSRRERDGAWDPGRPRCLCAQQSCRVLFLQAGFRQQRDSFGEEQGRCILRHSSGEHGGAEPCQRKNLAAMVQACGLHGAEAVCRVCNNGFAGSKRGNEARGTQEQHAGCFVGCKARAPSRVPGSAPQVQPRAWGTDVGSASPGDSDQARTGPRAFCLARLGPASSEGISRSPFPPSGPGAPGRSGPGRGGIRAPASRHAVAGGGGGLRGGRRLVKP